MRAVAAAFLLFWLYLNRKTVVVYSGCEETRWPLVQIGLLAIFAIVIFVLHAY
jgi:hypothetical protein